jgi:hypothetical protein
MDEHYGWIPSIERWCLMFVFVIGWGGYSSNLWKMQQHYFFTLWGYLTLKNKKRLPLCITKKIYLMIFLSVKVFPSISNSYEIHNKPSQFQEFDQHIQKCNAKSSTYFLKFQKYFQC